MNIIHKIFSSRSSLVGLFSVISIMLTIPLAILMTQQNQDVRQRAAGFDTQKAAVTVTTPTPIPQSSRTETISGYVFFDDNQNGHRDANEKPYSKATIALIQVRRDGTVNAKGENATPIAQLQSDANGYFTYLYRFSNQYAYNIKLILPDNYKTIDTNPIYIMNSDFDSQKVIEFGLFPITKILSVPACAPRPKCLETYPSCKIVEPIGGWCPIPTKIVSATPALTPQQHTPEVHGD